MKLRSLQDDDFKLLLRLFTDSQVRKHLGGALTTSEAAERVELLLQKKPECYWAILEEGHAVGTVIL